MSETIKIYCQNCKAYVLDLFPDKLSLPFKGWMFKYPDNVEWDTAFEPEAVGNDLVCPMCDSKFHREPDLFAEEPGFPDNPPMWLHVVVSWPKQLHKQIEPMGREKSDDPPKKVQEKKHGKKRRPGRPKGKRRKRSPAIKPNPRQGRAGEDSGNGADSERPDGGPEHHPQFSELADSGINVDESPGFSSD